MSERSEGLDPDTIQKSIRSRRRYRDMPDKYESYKEAFKSNFLIESSQGPAIVFCLMMALLLYKSTGSFLGTIISVITLGLLHAGLCTFLALFYKNKFMTRQIFSLICIFGLALSLWFVLSNPPILFFGS